MTNAPLPSMDTLTLTVKGWKQLANGRWMHPLMNEGTRVKLYTLEAAIAEQHAAENPEPPSPWRRIK